MFNKPFSRRSLIVHTGSVAAAGLLSTPINAASRYACLPQISTKRDGAMRQALADTPMVDVHTHIFNATDLPAYEWLKQVSLRKRPLVMKELLNYYQVSRQFIFKHTPDYYAEKTFLEYLRQNPDALKDLRESTHPDEIRETLLDLKFYQHYVRSLFIAAENKKNTNLVKIRTYLRELGVALALPRFRFPENNQADIRRFAEAIDKELSKRFFLNTKLRRQKDRGILDVDSLKPFLAHMGSSRVENFLHLRNSYALRSRRGAADPKLRVQPMFYTPAFVDVDYWLDSPETPRQSRKQKKAGLVNAFTRNRRTNLRQQIGLMRDLSLLFPGEVHSFFGFCPWRQLHADWLNEKRGAGRKLKTPLDHLKDAIFQYGFVGVKLYPPMGFAPIDNAKLDGGLESRHFPPHVKRFAYASEFGSRIDKSLMELYAFCSSNNVPIMAHAANSNSAGDYYDHNKKIFRPYGLKSDPKGWRSVLTGDNSYNKGFPNLSLNLAHFGFARDDFEDTIAELIIQFPWVYTDLSYFDQLLGSINAGKPCSITISGARRLSRNLISPKEGSPVHLQKYPAWTKIMYGSDWFMTTREKHYWNYLDVFAKVYFDEVANFNATQDEAADKFKAAMSANALRFLGLEDGIGDNSNFARLTDFYAQRENSSFATLKEASKVGRERLETFSSLVLSVLGERPKPL